MIRTVLIAATATAALFAFDAPVLAKSARDKAMDMCEARTTEELGKGKVTRLRTKRQRTGYKVTYTKLDASGDKLAKITCKVSSGEITLYKAKPQQDIAR